MLFSFVGGGVSLPEAVLDYVPGDWVGELSIMADEEKWHGIGRLSKGYLSRRLQSSILINALSSAYSEKKKKKEKCPRGFFPRWDMLCWLCTGFLQLLCTIEG
jgi:hypothetical protein